jgi:hypothetical protein
VQLAAARGSLRSAHDGKCSFGTARQSIAAAANTVMQRNAAAVLTKYIIGGLAVMQQQSPTIGYNITSALEVTAGAMMYPAAPAALPPQPSSSHD